MTAGIFWWFDASHCPPAGHAKGVPSGFVAAAFLFLVSGSFLFAFSANMPPCHGMTVGISGGVFRNSCPQGQVDWTLAKGRYQIYSAINKDKTFLSYSATSLV
jgi:hypothetical protein